MEVYLHLSGDPGNDTGGDQGSGGWGGGRGREWLPEGERGRGGRGSCRGHVSAESGSLMCLLAEGPLSSPM